MYKLVGYEYIEMTPEEEEEYRRQQEETPVPEVSLSLEERVALLEAERADMIAAYEEGVNDG